MDSSSPTNLILAKLAPAEAAQVATEAAAWSGAGVPLDQAFRACAEELGHGRLARAFRLLADDLAAGMPLESAFESRRIWLPADLRAIFLTAARSGRLPEVLDTCACLQQAKGELRRRICMALAYPAFLVATFLGISIFVDVFVIPKFFAVFRDFDLQLPAMTQYLCTLSGWQAPLGVTIFAGGFLVAAALLLIPNWAWSARLLHLLPLVGPIWRWHRQAWFARLMGLLLDQGTPLPEALILAGAASGDGDLAAACRQASQEVGRGMTLVGVMARRPQFAPSAIPLVHWGEQTSSLPDAFRAAAEMFETRSATQTVFLEGIALPILIVGLLFWVGVLIIALLLPMIALIQKLS